MTVLIALGCFTLGAVLAIWPKFFRKLSSFFDTLIHEAGHGLAALPFGAPLPSITVRSNSSGETQSAMGYLHQLLPFGLGTVTEKVARFLSLMAGYAASLVLAALLLVIAIVPEISFEPWQLFFVAQVALATVLWTLVRVTDSPLTFLVVGAATTGLYLWLFPWDWRVYGLILLGAVVLFFFARSWLSSLAVLLTLTAPLTLIFGSIVGDDHPFAALLSTLDFSVDSIWLARFIFAGLLAFLAFCCRSWLSLGLTVLILGSITGLLFVPWLPYSTVLFAAAGTLSVAGVKSLQSLYRLTFREKHSHWDQKFVETDMVFAAQELGGDPRYWYWMQVVVAAASSGAILLLGIVPWSA